MVDEDEISDRMLQRMNISFMQRIPEADMDEELLTVIKSMMTDKCHEGSNRGFKINGKLYFLIIDKKDEKIIINYKLLE